MEFTGGRTADDIVKWVLKKAGPPSVAATCDELKKKVEDNKLVMAYFGDASAAEFKVFEETANGPSGEKYLFFHIDSADCAKSHGAAETPSVVIFRKFDNSPLVHFGKIENPALNEFAAASSVPTLIDFSEDYIEPIFGNKKSAIFLFMGAGDKDKDFFKIFSESALNLKGQILFVHSGVSEGI